MTRTLEAILKRLALTQALYATNFTTGEKVLEKKRNADPYRLG
jgi:hypothetical protein